MTKPEAHAILTLARNGGMVPMRHITEALIATGDLSHWRAEQAQADYLPSSVEAEAA